jgi:hypothetical protein
MSFAAAAAVARDLREALAAEVERARGERRLLRTLDADRLHARAAERAEFLGVTARLERELAAELAGAAGRLGMREVTLQRIRLADPVHGAAVATAMAEVRALSGALAEIDRLNQDLARRAHACVSGYVDALAPVPSAYDRRGVRSRQGAPALALVSSKG